MDERLREIVDILTRNALENQQMEQEKQATAANRAEDDRKRQENWEKYEQLVASEDALSLLPPNISMTKENIQSSFIMQEFYPKLVDRGDCKIAIDQALQTLYEACELVGDQEVPLLRRYFHVIENFIWNQVDRTDINKILLEKVQERSEKSTPVLSPSEKQAKNKKLDEISRKLNHSYNSYITGYRNISRALRLPPVSSERLSKEIENLKKHRSAGLADIRAYYTENQDIHELSRFTKSLFTDMEDQKKDLIEMTKLIHSFSKKSLVERDAERKRLINLFVEENEFQKDLCPTPNHLLESSLEKQDTVSSSGVNQTEPYQPKEGEVDMSDPVALRQEIHRLLDLNAPWKEISPYYLQLETAAYRDLRPRKEATIQVDDQRMKLEHEIEELKNNYSAPILMNNQEKENMELIQQMYQNRLKTVEYYKTLSDQDFYSMTKAEAIAREEKYIENLKVQYDTILYDMKVEYDAAKPVVQLRQQQLIAQKQAQLDALPPVDRNHELDEADRLREEFQRGVEEKNKQSHQLNSTEQQEIKTPPIERPAPTVKADFQDESTISNESDDRMEVTSIDPNSTILVTDALVGEGLKAATQNPSEVVEETTLEEQTSSLEDTSSKDPLDPRNIVIGNGTDPGARVLNKFYVEQLTQEGKISSNVRDSLEGEYDQTCSEMFKINFELEKENGTDKSCQVMFIGPSGDGYNYDSGTKLGDFLDENNLGIDQVTIGVAVSVEDAPIYGCINGKDVQNIYQQAKSNSAKSTVQAQGKTR